MRWLLALCPVQFQRGCVFEQYGRNLDMVGHNPCKDQIICAVSVIMSASVVVMIVSMPMGMFVIMVVTMLVVVVMRMIVSVLV